MTLHRRDFVRLTAVSAVSHSRILGANDRIHLGAIGTGDRGRHDMGQFLEAGGVEVTALCDIYPDQMDKARQRVPNARNFSDHRRLLDLKDVDAVLICHSGPLARPANHRCAQMRAKTCTWKSP